MFRRFYRRSFDAGICTIRLLALVQAAAAVMVLTSCGGNQRAAEQAGLHFVESGICVTGLGRAEEVSSIDIRENGRWSRCRFTSFGSAVLVRCNWRPGEEAAIRITFTGRVIERKAVAPLHPGLALLGKIDLAPVLGGSSGSERAEPTAMAISDDGGFCAVGSSAGDVVVLSVPDGAVVGRAGSMGAYIRSLQFAADDEGLLLLAGEQSPRGAVTAFAVDEGGALRRLWSYETARDVGGPPLPSDSPYAWAHQPGIYRIMILDDGGALALAAASSAGAEPQRHSALYKLRVRNGDVIWRWPEHAPLEATATWFDHYRGNDLIAVCSYLDARRGGRGRLDLLDSDGRSLAAHEIEPLRPTVEQVSFWRSVAVGDDGSAALLSNDGRAWLLGSGAGGHLKPLELAEPIDLDGAPLLVSGAAVIADSGGPLFMTGTSFLPWSEAVGTDLKETHPSARTVFAFDWSGELRWVMPIPNLIQGAARTGRSGQLALCFAPDPYTASDQGGGMIILQLEADQPGIRVSYPVAGSVMHGSPQVWLRGELILLAETARRDRTGQRYVGGDALHILCW